MLLFLYNSRILLDLECYAFLFFVNCLSMSMLSTLKYHMKYIFVLCFIQSALLSWGSYNISELNWWVLYFLHLLSCHNNGNNYTAFLCIIILQHCYIRVRVRNCSNFFKLSDPFWAPNVINLWFLLCVVLIFAALISNVDIYNLQQS